MANEHSSLHSHEKWTKDRAIRAVSADGKVIGGAVASMITDEGVFADGRQGREIVPITLPAIWRGDVGEWNEKIELLDKPTYDATVTALNEDGTIAIGYINSTNYIPSGPSAGEGNEPTVGVLNLINQRPHQLIFKKLKKPLIKLVLIV